MHSRSSWCLLSRIGYDLGAESTAARHPGDHGEQLRLHASHGHATECHRLWKWPTSHGDDGSSWGGPECGGGVAGLGLGHVGAAALDGDSILDLERITQPPRVDHHGVAEGVQEIH